ncbi:hypothetical protein FA95DRAFT_1480416 [Auriscalpium vulgare]|uniref:Uncharacterized protein n=1 Tax=Auriscalpium vulgare TaxID=40419 RepID=A0ACB8SBX6_9AGAM|nr:hypothetical protein FA95DRAFT_1480416 [Auriscalpium vulgare]
MSDSASVATASDLTNSTQDGSWSFNVSFSLNFGSLLQYPSRLIEHLRKLDDMAVQSDESHTSALSSNGALARRMRGEAGPPPPAGFTPMPGPWSFFASGYAVTLFAMALLLNRIQHIVVPSRHPSSYLHDHHHQGRFSFLRFIYPTLFPIDLSSTLSRALFRIPSLYFIYKALALWLVILLQGTDYFPSTPWDFLQNLGAWTAEKDMEEVCWFTLMAVCGALCIGALTRGLEGIGSSNTSPFHLFGYAFLLHLYSSPITHTLKPEGLPTRPDVHVSIAIILPLLQLAIIHTLGVKRTWSRQRLIPTTICGLLTLGHFHYVLWTSPSSYPLVNYTACIFESFLVVVTCLAFFLNSITQLLLEGAITRPFFGHADTLMPKLDEDFSIVLLRLGTASLEATNVAGLGNEVSGVPLSKSSDATIAVYGEVQMSRAGVTSVSHPANVSGKRARGRDGFGNEIRTVRVTSTPTDSWPDAVWYREARRFAEILWRLVKGYAILAWRLVKREPGRLRPTLPPMPTSPSDARPNQDHDAVYQRFLAGETVSDDEDDDFDPRHESALPEHHDTDAESAEEEDEGGIDTAGLYADLSVTAASGASAPLLLAHMTDTSSSPLTRRRYSTLLAQPVQSRDEEGEWAQFVEHRRVVASASEKAREDDERRRNCVICTVEERQIICWPCRCLALCDDCRENLASRFSASRHTCPCCRQAVEGFSRIYIP